MYRSDIDKIERLKFSPMFLFKLQTKRIKIILQDILDNHSEFCVNGEPSLEWMRALSTADVKAKLTAYDGVGPKVSLYTTLITAFQPLLE